MCALKLSEEVLHGGPMRGGRGLGLYLSRNLALSNHDSLDYRPVEGGSVFSLSLPTAF